MEKPKLYELRAEYDGEQGKLRVSIAEVGVDLPRAVTSVRLQPHSDYKTRLRFAHEWLAAVAGVELEHVRGA